MKEVKQGKLVTKLLSNIKLTTFQLLKTITYRNWIEIHLNAISSFLSISQLKTFVRTLSGSAKESSWEPRQYHANPILS